MFFSKAERELKGILKELKNFLSNNYKDAAHEYRILLGEKSKAYYKAGKLSYRRYLHYRKLYQEYSEQMKDYHH